MFVPCIIKRSRKNQYNAQTCTAVLFHMLAPKCFGSSLPSSGSCWIRLSYLKIQIDMVVYHIMWLSGQCVGVSRFSLLCFPTECKMSVLVCLLISTLFYTPFSCTKTVVCEAVQQCVPFFYQSWDEEDIVIKRMLGNLGSSVVISLSVAALGLRHPQRKSCPLYF
jgi:hypothetical protein